MSDCWTYSSSSTPPITYHSSLSQTSSSLSYSHSSFRNHGNSPHTKVTSPHLLPQHQVSSSPFFHQPQISSPQTPSPHLLPPQLTSPQFSYPPVTSPHLIHHPQVTSPHPEPQPLITSPHLLSPPQHTLHPELQPQIISPHLLSPPQHPFFSQNPDMGLDHPDWIKCEPSSELSCLLNGNSFSYQQNQTSAHLDFQNQFSSGLAHHGDSLENTHRSYDTQTLLFSGVCTQSDTSNPGEDTWRHLEPTMSQLQCSALDSMSAGAQQVAPSPGLSVGGWSSTELNSAEDFSSTQFFQDGYLNASQPFCSPTTPGPSPHYPQTPTVSSPSPQMHPRTERTGFHTQLNRDHTSDSGQYHQHQTSQRLFPSQTEQIQDLTGLLHTAGSFKTSLSTPRRSQHVRSASQSMSLSAGLNWTEECGGGKGGGKGRGDDSQADWNWMQTEHTTESLDSRLLCMVCKRDFRSLPALNGHMRSHSGFRSATCLKKDSPPPVQRPFTMVMPVSVPVKSRSVSKASRGSQTRSSRLPQATGSTALFRSLMHPQEEEDVTKGIRHGENRVVSTTNKGRGHYTPPPMLCPQRAGPGLYCSLTTRRQQRVQTVQLHNGVSDLGVTDTAFPPPGTLTSGIIKPRINLEQGFQADIPPLRDQKYAQSDSHNAMLQWTPWDDLERPVNQDRVEALLMLARSNVVPGGGANAEYTLQVLSECRGDFLLTVEKLLSTPETNNNHHHHHHHLAVSWNAAEKRSLVKSLQLHHKDFSSIQKAVQTKSLSECVEFYYLWKKKLSLRTKAPTSLTVSLPKTNSQRSSRSQVAS